MKLKFILFFSCLATGSLSTADVQFQSYSAKDKKYENVIVVESQGVSITKSCFQGGKLTCLAGKAVGKKIPRSGSPTGLAGNPAARYCLDHGANNRIFLNAKKQEFDFCVFSDNSAVDAWSLYNKHYNKSSN